MGQLHPALRPLHPQHPPAGSVLLWNSDIPGAGVSPAALPQPSGGPFPLHIHDQRAQRGAAGTTLLSKPESKREHETYCGNCGWDSGDKTLRRTNKKKKKTHGHSTYAEGWLVWWRQLWQQTARHEDNASVRFHCHKYDWLSVSDSVLGLNECCSHVISEQQQCRRQNCPSGVSWSGLWSSQNHKTWPCSKCSHKIVTHVAIFCLFSPPTNESWTFKNCIDHRDVHYDPMTSFFLAPQGNTLHVHFYIC